MKNVRRLPATLVLMAALLTLSALPAHAAVGPGDWMSDWLSRIVEWFPQPLDPTQPAAAESVTCQEPCDPPAQELPSDPTSPEATSPSPPEGEEWPLIDPDG